MPEVQFSFLRASVLRDDGARSALEGPSGLPSFQSIMKKRPNWIVSQSVSELQACQHKLVDRFLTVSHRWETDKAPDEKGAQLASVVAFVKSHPKVEFVWFDYWCMPQGSRTPSEQAEFDRQLPNINLLYLGGSVLLLVDLSYSSRFWTQYEAWLSMQEASPAGLRGAPPATRRCTIVCLWNAQPKYQGEQLIEMWASKSPEEAHQMLSQPDVTVTNTRDKEMQLPKIRGMALQVKEVLRAEEQRQRDREETRRRKASAELALLEDQIREAEQHLLKLRQQHADLKRREGAVLAGIHPGTPPGAPSCSMVMPWLVLAGKGVFLLPGQTSIDCRNQELSAVHARALADLLKVNAVLTNLE